MQISYYDVFLDFDFKGLKYYGKEKIQLQTEDKVILDADGVKVTKVSSNGKDIPYEVSEKTVTINTGNFSGELEVEFEGKVRDDLVGIYVAPYDNSYIITTQFESSHARKFIPCVDNPSYKAEFKFTVRLDKDLDVISNMPIQRIRYDNDKKIVEFLKTPRMSTYLIYLGIGKFEEYYDYSFEPTIIVATVPGKISRAEIPASFARNFIKFYEDYFGIKYPLPKEHLIAVPEFAFGAMENWGAITFRETALLADKNSTIRQLRRVAEVVAHELAHQWFGDLVTMKWWNDLWLNESFATFMSYKAVNWLKPEWDFWGDFVYSETSGAMEKDSLHITHPIEANVKSVEEIEEIFDDISYGKGASILRMIEYYLGNEDFRKGISAYLQAHKYSNAEGKDLWLSLEQASGKPVSKIMESWITQEGYPIVSVKINGNTVIFEQERFLQDGSVDSKIYLVPLTFEINNKKYTMLLESKNQEFKVNEPINSIKVNLDRSGFYRVYYENTEKISNLNSLEKFGLINDYFSFLLSGKINFEQYEKIAQSMMNEDNYLPVLELSSQLMTLYLINKQKYGKLAIDFHKSQEKIWSQKKDELGKITYASILEHLVLMDNSFANELSKKMNENVDPEIKDAVFMAFARTYEDEAYDKLLKLYKEEKFDEEKQRYLKALLSFKNSYLVSNTLSLSLTGMIKKQDILRILPLAARNLESRRAVWIWLKTYIDEIRKAYAGTGILGRVLSDTLPILGLENVNDVVTFFSEYKIPEAKKGIAQGLEMLKILSRLA
ncbi:leucyl aminopeptidase [Acidianus sulfidivorans JP7]|uniref:Aminopeptidase n=1 Tax=Acidianus sulfidivorans JP7 TaxID=619593 RepID=A0A2U9IKD4_9CREN|nr:M1 family metallopeptidase [Acidianus sulfidivorans]AWR96488.1 leucyl aminopeptidase [Acidianus sulfidivorans JP7]